MTLVTTGALYLLVRLGADRYAIEIAVVEEVVPLVRLKALPGAPAGVAGIMNYRNEPVPVVDLSLLALSTPTAPRLASRIVVVRYGGEVIASAASLLGLLVPEATEMRRVDAGEFVDAGVATNGTPYLGGVLATPEGVIQRVSVGELLTPELREALQRALIAS